MSKKTITLRRPLILTGVLTVLAASGVLIYNKLSLPEAQPIQVAEITSTGSVTLSLSPSALTLSPNSESTVSLVANSGSEKLTIVKFEINYDPAKVAITNLTKGSWLTQALAAPTISSGKISGILAAQPDPTVTTGGAELNRTGTGTILTFKVKPLTYGSHAVNFNVANSQATTTSRTTNALKSVNNLTISSKLITDIVGTDRRVDMFDYNAFLLQFGSPGTADFNNSGTVDIFDYSTLISDYGKSW